MVVFGPVNQFFTDTGQPRPVLAERHGAVPAQREEHAGSARHTGHSAEELSGRGDEQHDARPVGGQGLVEDHRDGTATLGHAGLVLHREEEVSRTIQPAMPE
jgi:hypothetical protein